MKRVHIEKGDLTTRDVDAIVNAANNDLLLGGGLAGAIARKAGPSVQEECNRHGPIKVGQAAITAAGMLPARHIIHQASMSLGSATTAEALRQSTAAVLELAEEHDLRTLAFPAVGTGIGGFSTRLAATIMLEEVARHLRGQTHLTDIYFVLFDDPTLETFQQVYDQIAR
jgi:O-acetyl-ADP-ribose deacetylase (regulator of RNase III)